MENELQDSDDSLEKTRKRSPNFPSMSLSDALEKAKELQGKYETRSVPMSLLAETWGFSAKSSGFIKAVAALGYYGLMETEGTGEKRRARLSRAGERIIGGAPDAAKLLQEAALKPRLFREVWDKYNGNIPNDELLAHDLKWGEIASFTDEARATFIANFRTTIAFARIQESDIIPPGDCDRDETGEKSNSLPATPLPRNIKMHNITIPLTGGVLATVQVPVPMSKKDYGVLKRALELFESTLVAEELTQNENKA